MEAQLGVSDTVQAQLEAHRSFLKRLARSLVTDVTLADDLVQETALAALMHGPQVRHSRGWLSRVLRRKVSRYRERSSVHDDKQRLAAAPESIASHVAAVDRRMDLDYLLTERVRALPKAQARAIGMRYNEGRSISEIAESLGAPEATIKARLKRGLAQLRKDIDRAHGGDGKQWLAAVAPLAGVEWTKSIPTSLAVKSMGSKAGAAGIFPWTAFALLIGAVGLAGQQLGAKEVAILGPETELTGLAGPEKSETAQPQSIEIQHHRVTATTAPPAATEFDPATKLGSALAARNAPDPDKPTKRKLNILSMGMEESAPSCTVRFILPDGARGGLAGIAKIKSPHHRDRKVEFRGYAIDDFKMLVPANARIVFAGRFDGFEPVESSFRSGPANSTLDQTIELVPSPNWAEVTLILPRQADGSNYPDDSLYYVNIEGPEGLDLAMPTRSARSIGAKLHIGRVHSGQALIRGYTYGSAGLDREGKPMGFALVFEARTTLLKGERRRIPVEPTKCGTIRLDVTDSSGQSIPASFYFVRKGIRKRLVPGVARVGYSSSDSKLDGKGPLVLRGIRCVPALVHLHVESPGFMPRSIPIVLQSEEVLEQVVALVRASN